MRSMRTSALLLGAVALLVVDVGSADAGAGAYTRSASDLHALSASLEKAPGDQERQLEETGSDGGGADRGEDAKLGDTSGDE